MNKLALIDGDALCYQSSKEILTESIQNIDEKINNIFEKTRATHYIIFISNTPYFRHKISSDYKSARSKHISPLKWLKTLKKYLVEGWGAQSMNLVEADDLCAYWYNFPDIVYGKIWVNSEETGITIRSNSTFHYEEVQKILCSPDKDLLQSITGKHFNYSYKLEDKIDLNSIIKGWWVETTQEDVTKFYGKQLLMGDSTDGISALNGIGEVKAIKILDKWGDGMLETFILDYYIEYYKGDVPKAIFEFQKTYRLLHMLDCDEDFIREVGVLPTFPEIRQVSTKPIEVVNLEELKF